MREGNKDKESLGEYHIAKRFPAVLVLFHPDSLDIYHILWGKEEAVEKKETKSVCFLFIILCI